MQVGVCSTNVCCRGGHFRVRTRCLCGVCKRGTFGSIRTIGDFIGCSLPLGGIFGGVSFLTHCSVVASRDGNAVSRAAGALVVGSCTHRHIANKVALDLSGTFVTSLHLGFRGCFCGGSNVPGRSRQSGVIVRFVAEFWKVSLLLYRNAEGEAGIFDLQ